MAELVVQQPSFFTSVADLITDDRLPSWKIWAKWKLVVVAFAVPVVGLRERQRFHFYGTILSGTPVLKERWKRGGGAGRGGPRRSGGKIYIERHLLLQWPRSGWIQLVANLIEAYRQSIIELDWMTEATKQRALDKLRQVSLRISAFPPSGGTTPTLQIDRHGLVDNVMRAAPPFEVRRSARQDRPARSTVRSG